MQTLAIAFSVFAQHDDGRLMEEFRGGETGAGSPTRIQAAHGAKLKRGSFYRNKYNKLKFKLGSANKAKVAIANRLARTIYKVMGGANFKDLGYCRAVEHEDKIRSVDSGDGPAAGTLSSCLFVT